MTPRPTPGRGRRFASALTLKFDEVNWARSWRHGFEPDEIEGSQEMSRFAGRVDEEILTTHSP